MSEELAVSSFTIVLPENALVIPVEVGISQFEPGRPEISGEVNAPGRLYTGAIDTGASNSCISVDVATELNLIRTGYINVGTANGICEQSCHIVNVSLPNSLICTAMQVTAGDIGIDLLLGMDILGRGDLHIIHRNGHKIVHFHMYTPSTRPAP